MSDREEQDGAAPAAGDAPEGWIGNLLRTTGRRPAVPEDRARRVEAIVRAHFRERVRTRSRARTTWRLGTVAAAAAATAFAVGLWSWERRDPTPIGPRVSAVEIVVATAWVRLPAAPGDSRVAVRPGDRIVAGATLSTEGAGRLALRTATGHSVRVDVATEMRVVAEHTFALERGALYVDSAGSPRTARVEIRTPFGSIRGLGTQFEARLSDEAGLRVRVREGAVTVERPDEELEVRAGQQLDVNADGTTARSNLQGFGDAWTWIGTVAPLPDLEGRPLDEFLRWMARERGLQLTHATARVAEEARRTKLSGSIRGMTLDQALDSVLSASRMEHRIDGGRLVVDLQGDGEPE